MTSESCGSILGRFVGRRPISAFAAEGAYVRVHFELPTATVFVGRETPGGFVPEGTGFLIGFSYRDFAFAYLVTADHVVEDIPGDVIAARLNRKTGDATTVTLKKNNRIQFKHELDIAMFGIDLDASIYDQTMVKIDREEHNKTLETFYRPGLGDEVATVGLYSTHFGSIRNLPVVRIGHIALMPGEPVLSHRGYVTAYLIETKSIGGLSGSPVWLNVPSVIVRGGQLQHFHDRDQACVPLGIVTGYHMVASDADQIPVPRIQGSPLKGSKDADDNRNTGFAVVIPWEILLDMKDDPQMKKLLDDAIEAHIKGSGARPASVFGGRIYGHSELAKDENPQHREDFTRLLGAATRKPKQGG